jgi:molybdopterin-binding protein
MSLSQRKNQFEENCKKIENGLRNTKVDVDSEDRISNLKLVLTLMKKNVLIIIKN